MLATTVKVDLKNIDTIIKELPGALSAALNDSLFDTRAKMIRQLWPTAALGARGKKLTVKRQRLAGASALKVQRSDPVSLTGQIDANLQAPERAELLKWRSSLTAKEWIRGFVHSTHPIFVGKSRQDRIRMALGAYYRIRHGLTFREHIAKFESRTIEDVFIQLMKENSLRTFPRRANQALRGQQPGGGGLEG